jgi:acyl carrier protein
MKFEEFCVAMFSLLEQEPVPVTETTSLRDELNVDSLQMVNLITSAEEYFNVPFEHFIENVDNIGTVGGLYEVVKGGLS